jgi:ubiquinone/menaquinone biosynthesis C-methylase UbiE
MSRKHLGRLSPIRLLDLGAADGRTMLEIRDLLGEGEYLGIERSRGLLASSVEMPAGLRLIEGDAERLPDDIMENSFDVVTALALLEHLADPLRAVAEVARVLRPGGIFIATCPVPFWDHVSGRLGLLQEKGHVSSMGKSRLLGTMRSAGLDVLEYRRFMFAPVGFLPYLGVRVPPGRSVGMDRVISGVGVFNWLFVNQCAAARKPRG